LVTFRSRRRRETDENRDESYERELGEGTEETTERTLEFLT